MLSILLGLIVLVFLAYKGYNIIWVAPVAAMIVAVLGGLELFTAYTETYMDGLVGFAKSWFPIFLFGAVFGKMMEITGLASSVAKILAKVIGSKRAILAVVISCAVLTYGGVSLFVVVFAIYPLALELYKEADITRKLIPGAIALGAFTFTMTALPGSPQLNNLIAARYLGTTAMASPILGIIAAVIMLVGGYLYLSWREKKLRAAGEHYTSVDDERKQGDEDLPHWIFGVIPLVAVVITLNVFEWPAIAAIGIGIVLIVVFNIKQWKKFITAINDGASGSVMAIMNTSAAVGFGSVVKAVPGFATLTNVLLGMGGSPLVSEAIAITTLAGATGSSSGGMTIALEALAEKYLEAASAMNISPEAFHRVATVASGGLDSLPHCGAVITLLAVCKLTHKDSYTDIGVVTCVIPIAAVIVIVALGSIGIV
ncbi:GntP family permease [bacterium 1XD42-8]|jgi:H+/gluconate symporter-like permease|nr:GntP family permease [Lachnospiraceae bacterium]RKJ54004.1 GntP family permease [bacterium 1XD42-8]